MTILNKILHTKKSEIKTLKKEPLIEIRPKIRKPLIETIQNNDHLSIIAEIKRASPSKGRIANHIDPIKLAKDYERFGATAISVLTDSTYFKGSFTDLKAVSQAVNIPVLCKDFIIDPIQIDHAKVSGAQIILLIVAALSPEQLTSLYKYAKSLSLDVLVEVHNRAELDQALNLGAKIIGINNRNLKTFTVDLMTTERLIQHIDNDDLIVVSESGLKTRKDIEQVAKAGAKAILVGETFMVSKNLQESFVQFTCPLPNEGS